MWKNGNVCSEAGRAAAAGTFAAGVAAGVVAADCALRSPRGAGRVEHGCVVVGQDGDLWKCNVVFDLLHCAGPGLRAIKGLTSIASNQHGEQRAGPLLANARPAFAIDQCHAAA